MGKGGRGRVPGGKRKRERLSIYFGLKGVEDGENGADEVELDDGTP